MLTSTDDLGGCADYYKKQHEEDESTDLAPCEIDEEVQEEINDLLKNVDEVRQNFTVINKIGSGTFSSVYVAKLKNLVSVKQMFALKHLIPTSHPSRIVNELRCLQQIGGKDHVMGVKACIRQRDHIVIVMPYFPHERFQDYLKDTTVSEVREYMCALLIALRRVHSVNIIHRDVKPSNFLYNRKLQQYALVDFGLAQILPKHQADDQSIGDQTETSNNSKTSQKRKLSDKELENSPKKKCTSNASEKCDQNQIFNTNAKYLAEKDPNVQTHKQSRKPVTRRASNNKSIIKPSNLDNLRKDISTTETNNPKQLQTCTSTLLNKDSLQQTEMEQISKSIFSPGASKEKSLSKNLLKKLTLESLDSQKAGNVQLTAPGRKHQQTSSVPPTSRPPASASTCGPRGSTVIVNHGGKQMYRNLSSSAHYCDCYGKPQVCSICLARSTQHAARAGTPGFRAPEVLLKCPDQTTAVDIWSSGVIFLSLLSGRYPFFKAADDLHSLAQIITLFGSKTVHTEALAMGKHLLSNPHRKGVSLKDVCYKLRGIPITNPPSQDIFQDASTKLKTNSSILESVVEENWHNVPESAFDLLNKLLQIDPKKRLTAEEALQHEFFSCLANKFKLQE